MTENKTPNFELTPGQICGEPDLLVKVITVSDGPEIAEKIAEEQEQTKTAIVEVLQAKGHFEGKIKPGDRLTLTRGSTGKFWTASPTIYRPEAYEGYPFSLLNRGPDGTSFELEPEV